ncbi:MAG: hypothetical protein UT87_C0002G0022 [Candidatus Levybacteria bacterium GW2011_GWC1_40_19]|nr:MAG: hypothetical protein UT46_C0002G0025 [Candidatus Levybacteria bacterium GW2011_GWA1_39_34]KKR51641.1 MAG: hypothetical protein UT87_C0002G0022 [Candidatus Levybacteria bacterium GW2011_GWC1_40_19]KKR72399.1 MAG: hypothetical protein UU15_C0029G0006 [Candidatus Levybacteria bacterium GW2011_GWC2_40_7]KKR95491.1 MAG: hypothetical protein UU45_C0001G0086 [Candidatus Levybacteria bacterium GW2011_GWA2_41_15]KKS02438.1 MAG: hypothetical protein UU52_C0001G0022 [Candidatus Levybacteria bacter
MKIKVRTEKINPIKEVKKIGKTGTPLFKTVNLYSGENEKNM